MTTPTGDHRAGLAFSSQPELVLKDKGLNILIDDSTSKVRVQMGQNPNHGTLSPASVLTTRVDQGRATFRSLMIDSIGMDYSLEFILYSKVPELTNTWKLTGLSLESPSFAITLGLASKLILTSLPMGAVTDAQPILTQPVVELRDYGDNVITTEDSLEITASLVPSLALKSAIVVETSSSPNTVAVVQVRASALEGFVSPFGVGQELDLEVEFTQEVILVTGGATLSLNTGRQASCVTEVGSRQRTLVFRYTIASGDTPSSALNYVDTSALVLNADSAIQDGNSQAVDLTLPEVYSSSSLAPSTLVVNPATPTIVSVTCALVPGTYGVGQEIDFTLTYDAPVHVSGFPSLAFTNAGISGKATYVSGSSGLALVFRYVVSPVDDSASFSLVLASAISVASGEAMQRATSNPSQDVDLAVSSSLVSDWGLVVDTAPVTVDSTTGISAVDGTYAPGDKLDIQVPFTALVSVSGTPELTLSTGHEAVYVAGSGSAILTFQYTVQSGDISTDLDTLALLTPLPADSIKRHVTQGTAIANVDLDLSSSISLAAGHELVLDGAPVTISSLSFATDDGTYGRHAVLEIILNVNKPVRVIPSPTTGQVPTLVLALTSSIVEAQALYVSGSGTSALTFQYTVALGDSTSALEYQSSSSLRLNGAQVLRESSNPTMSIDDTLPPPSSSALGNIVLDPTSSFKVSIVSCSSSTPAGEYGETHVIELFVVFSDPVVVHGSPTVGLDTGHAGVYVSGSGTSTLTFMYIVESGHTTLSLDLASVECSGPYCQIVDANNQLVDLSVSSVTLSPGGIAINTQAPTVLSLVALTAPPDINDAAFIFGDEIDIQMTFSKDVYVSPHPADSETSLVAKVPLLELETGNFHLFTYSYSHISIYSYP